MPSCANAKPLPRPDEALQSGRTHIGPDAEALIALPEIEVIVEATGMPGAGIRHALASIAHGKHIVMVNVEADALVGPLLARRAAVMPRSIGPSI